MSAQSNDAWHELIHQRADKGLLAKFLHRTLPPNPEVLYVWPRFAYVASKYPDGINRRSVLRFMPVALLFFALTLGAIFVLLQVPGLNHSIVGLLSKAFSLIMPQAWATGVAWVVGLIAVIGLGDFAKQNDLQRALNREPASRNSFYNLWLLLALREELVFRAGSENWSIRQRLQASVMFGAIHITNIWYSFAAGIALSLTGFGFMLVYLWTHRRYRNQLIATSYAATVHALYNIVALATIALLLLVLVISLFI